MGATLMHLSQTAEYALRALTWLTLHGDGPVRAGDLARTTNIPAAYLSKLLRRLVSAGLLSARKGHGGGFTLARAPSEIRFADVLEAVDDLHDDQRCAFGQVRCDEANPCPLHPAWAELRASMRVWAGKRTLADVANDAG